MSSNLFVSIASRIRNFWKHRTTTQIIVFSFAAVILTGATILNLPFSSQDGQSVGFLNALFTATSATCVTGLTVVITESHWTIFGKVIILLLIQTGGLGFLTFFTMFLILIGRKITLKDRLVIQESFNQSDTHGMVRLILNIVKGVFVIQGLGALILAIRFSFDNGFNAIESLALGLFHSISAFNNAGFDILGDYSLMTYVGDPAVNLVIMSQIVLGGIGFSVWFDIHRVFFKEKLHKKSWKMAFWGLHLHTKIALTGTAILLFSGALFFFIVEFGNNLTIGKLSLGEKIWASFFQSVTTRTAGYFSMNQNGLTNASKFMSVILMAIGGSPGGTAGGVKTVTMGVIIVSVLSVIKGKSRLEVFRKSIASDLLQKSLTVMIMIVTTILLGSMILSLSEHNNPNFGFIDYLFESASATGTVGLTTGITPSLTPVGKMTMILSMFLGRTGPVSVILALTLKSSKTSQSIKFPEEKVVVG